ncbi:hypothetical protein G6F40_016912 [Rhizopus arrhizus]|nr:hypothetical protein G6F40_016912 [Rhizopus arrhizus]
MKLCWPACTVRVPGQWNWMLPPSIGRLAPPSTCTTSARPAASSIAACVLARCCDCRDCSFTASLCAWMSTGCSPAAMVMPDGHRDAQAAAEARTPPACDA